MSLILAIDASTYAGSVAVIRDGALAVESGVAMRGEHEERLMPAVAAALQKAGASASALSSVVCGAGPGSFTSLRIAAAIAKGLAASTGAQLCAVPSLALAASSAVGPLPRGTYVAVLDAMRGEYFAQPIAIDDDGCLTMIAPYALIAASELAGFAAAYRARLLDPDFSGAHVPHARGVARLLTMSSLVREVDLASWEPDYGRLAEAQVKWEKLHGRALEVR